MRGVRTGNFYLWVSATPFRGVAQYLLGGIKPLVLWVFLVVAAPFTLESCRSCVEASIAYSNLHEHSIVNILLHVHFIRRHSIYETIPRRPVTLEGLTLFQNWFAHDLKRSITFVYPRPMVLHIIAIISVGHCRSINRSHRSLLECCSSLLCFMNASTFLSDFRSSVFGIFRLLLRACLVRSSCLYPFVHETYATNT